MVIYGENDHHCFVPNVGDFCHQNKTYKTPHCTYKYVTVL